MRGLLELAALLEELRGGRDCAIIFRGEPRDASPRLRGRGEVASTLLVQRGELLFERNLRIDVARRVGFRFEHVGEVVPPLRLLEEARKSLPRRVVAAVERQELLQGADRAVDVAQIALADAGDLTKALFARLERLVGCAHRAYAREEHVAQLRIIAFAPEVVLDPRERFGMRGIRLEDFLVLCKGFGLLPFASEHLRCVEHALQAIGWKVAEAPRLDDGLATFGGLRVPLHLRHVGRWNHALSSELGELLGCVRVGAPDRLEDGHRLCELTGCFVRRRKPRTGVDRHRPVGILRDVREVPCGKLGVASERSRVVHEELQAAIVARVEVERARGVRETVFAVVHLGQRDEHLARGCTLGRTDGLSRGDTIEHGRRELLLDGGVLRIDLACPRERSGRSCKVTARAACEGLVTQKRDTTTGIGLDRELRLVERVRLLVCPLRFEQLARLEDRERVLRVELGGALVVVDGLARLGERRFGPESPELLVHGRELGA